LVKIQRQPEDNVSDIYANNCKLQKFKRYFGDNNSYRNMG